MSNDRANMAFAGDTPWHGLGQAMDADAPLEIWAQQAGMEWEIKESVVEYKAGSNILQFPERKVLYRSDTLKPLSAVSQTYCVVQPKDVLEFYRDLIDTAGFKMRTAGVLFGGKKFWALADIGKSAKVKANEFGGYLLLATACDGSMATVGQFTSVEVVCNNTLRMAVQNADGTTKPRVSIPHNTTFDPDKVKRELGLAAGSWDAYINDVRQLAERPVTNREAVQWLIDVFGDPELSPADQAAGDAKIMKMIHSLFTTDGAGHELEGRAGTLLGLVSATTEYYDYHTGHRTVDGRLDKAWFGETAAMKQKAWDTAMLLAA
jgi:phage/plasmid-like protein (TIGR03299 family)